MDVKTACEKLAEIEQKFNVNAIYYGDMRIWPIIRSALWPQLCHPELNIMQLPIGFGGGRLPLVSSENEKTGKILTSCKYLKGYMKKLGFHNGQLKKIVGKSNIDIIFFSRSQDHKEQVRGKDINPFLDPLINLISEQHSQMKIEIESDLVLKKTPRLVPTVSINAIRFFVKNGIISRNGKSSKIDKINNFGGLKTCVRKIVNGIELNEKYFLNIVATILNYEKFFTEVLSIIRPKAVFLVCYYYPVAMSLISACRKLGIKSVEVQHGKQGKYHGMYTHWTKIPMEGYELLPDFFWVWGEETRQNIRLWQPDGLKRNIPVVGGNLWLSEWIYSNHFEDVSGEYYEFKRMLERYEKIILYTAQPIPDPFPECLLEAIRMSPDSWIWLIRLHPTQRNQLPEIDNFLKTGRLDNYEMKISSEISLYSLLKNIDHHVTCWSTVCYEALYFDVPTTIVHENGASLYKEYIQQGIFSYATEVQKLFMVIKSGNKNEPPIEDVRYIETDPQMALEALEIVLRN